MALSIKKLIEEAKKLPPRERKKIIEALQPRKSSSKKHKISEIEGLGADLWRSVDVDKYIETERNTWDS
ncbi:MAG: hypothetical protein FJ088_06385, partial [Deltaproteobacteria bacterium]|nr:hypothetical protein [Deltaproteobacteria bacterium]